jgi:hypothetical protein
LIEVGQLDNEAVDADISKQEVLASEMASLRAANSNTRMIEDIIEDSPAMSAQEVQMRVMSRFNCFLSVHGGNSELAVNFGGKMILYIEDMNWYDQQHTRDRLHGIAGTDIKKVKNSADLMEALPHLTADACGRCQTD